MMPKTKSNKFLSDQTSIDDVIYASNLLRAKELKAYSRGNISPITSTTFVSVSMPIAYCNNIIIGKFSTYFDKISFDNKTIQFKKGISLQLEISHEESLYIVYNDLFGTYGSGLTRTEAFADFSESFVEFYDDIVNTPEDVLGNSSLVLKKILTSYTTLIEDE